MINNAPNNPKGNNGKTRYKQGNFIPENKDKVVKLNSQGGIYYRSGFEYKVYKYMDLNPKIIRWGAEFISIPYTKRTPKKDNGDMFIKESSHRYFPDVYYEILKDGNKVDKVIAEIKPYSETQPPKVPTRATKKQLENFEYSMNMYNANLFKWDAAINYCENRELRFVIITEQYLKILTNS